MGDPREIETLNNGPVDYPQPQSDNQGLPQRTLAINPSSLTDTKSHLNNKDRHCTWKVKRVVVEIEEKRQKGQPAYTRLR